MASAVDKIQDILKESAYSDSQFYRDYKKFALTYQDLIDKGVVSKRQSQLLSISDKVTMASMHFNRPQKLERENNEKCYSCACQAGGDSVK